MRGLAIDPGSTESAVVVYEGDERTALTGPGRVLKHETLSNQGLLEILRDDLSSLVYGLDWYACEWMEPRGMPTSAQEFETLFWIGRFAEALENRPNHNPDGRPAKLERVTRRKVKQHLGVGGRGAVGEKLPSYDARIRSVLIDRWGGIGGKEAAMGRKASPGPLYGISGDQWAALALAVTVADNRSPEEW